MKLLIEILILIGIAHGTSAQQHSPSAVPDNGIRVGDRVPSILIKKVINDKRGSYTITDFKDQLLILDFWATTCSACIEALPKMDSLQKQFGEKIKILPVTYEDETKVRAFLQRNPLVMNITVPSVVEDNVLSKRFPHRAQPHEVWIHKGKVVAITDGQYVDSKNIQKVLDNQVISWPVKDDFYRYDYKKPFLSLENVKLNRGNNNLSYVAVTGYQEGAKPTLATALDSVTRRYRTYMINYPVVGAYAMLWKKLGKPQLLESAGRSALTGGVSPNQIVLEVKDPIGYRYDPSQDYSESWERKYDISYEWIAVDTAASKEQRNQLIIGDIDRLLGLKGRWEKRKVNCLILVRTDSVEKFKSLGGESKFDYQSPVKRLRNSSLSNLPYFLNSFYQNPPVFDETGFIGKVDLDLAYSSWTDIPAIRRALRYYGLDLKQEVRILDMLVITENN